MGTEQFRMDRERVLNRYKMDMEWIKNRSACGTATEHVLSSDPC